MPYRETPPFSLTFKVRRPLSLLLSWAFSARRRSSSACISDSLIVSSSDSLHTIHFASFPAGRFLTGTYRYSVSRLIPNSRASAAFESPSATRRRNSAASAGGCSAPSHLDHARALHALPRKSCLRKYPCSPVATTPCSDDCERVLAF